MFDHDAIFFYSNYFLGKLYSTVKNKKIEVGNAYTYADFKQLIETIGYLVSQTANMEMLSQNFVGFTESDGQKVHNLSKNSRQVLQSSEFYKKAISEK